MLNAIKDTITASAMNAITNLNEYRMLDSIPTGAGSASPQWMQFSSSAGVGFRQYGHSIYSSIQRAPKGEFTLLIGCDCALPS